MPKLWHDNNLEVSWICNNEEEAFTACYENYRLTVERKKTNLWVWEVFYREEEIITRLPKWTDSKYRAIGMAEGLFIAHQQFFREEKEIEIRFFKSAANENI